MPKSRSRDPTCLGARIILLLQSGVLDSGPTVRAIARHLKMRDASVYKACVRLVREGLLLSTKENSTRSAPVLHFRPVPPEVVAMIPEETIRETGRRFNVRK